MHRLSATLPRQRQRQRGITLIESLVAIIVAALGILGILGVQMRTLTDTQTSVRRAQAIRLIEDLSERMKVHPNALASIGSYAMGWGTLGTPTAQASTQCDSTNCTRSQLAEYDIREWKRAVETLLPLGNATTFVTEAEADGNRRQIGVMVAWRENERDIADEGDRKKYKDAFNAGASRKADGSISDKDAAACPDGFACHLQYIPVPARCAPYFAGNTSAQYYCPGA